MSVLTIVDEVLETCGIAKSRQVKPVVVDVKRMEPTTKPQKVLTVGTHLGYFSIPIMQYVLGFSLHKSNTRYLLFGLYNASNFNGNEKKKTLK